jgi:hypothetical protein
MPDPEDLLAVLAESSRLHGEAVLRLQRLHHVALRLQMVALALLGLSLLGIGVLLWQVQSYRQTDVAVQQALMRQSQVLRQWLGPR